MPAPYKGGCQCGAVRFEINAEPLTAYVCHCITCQKQSGSAFGMAIVVPTDAIAVLEGGTSTFIKTADSGRESDCAFCCFLAFPVPGRGELFGCGFGRVAGAA